MGVEAGMEARGLLGERTLVVLSGEGRTLEMGAGDFIAAFDREQRVTFIILDNQAYASSGSASSPTTPLKAATRIFSRSMGGKGTAERNMPMMMIFSKARYVATAVSAYVRDLVVKVQEALQHQPAYLHIVVPCQVSWMYSPDHGVALSRRLVQTGMVPLWSFKEGVFKRTVRLKAEERMPVEELLKLQRRYENVRKEDLEELEAHIERKNALVDALEEALTSPDTVSW